MNFELDFINGKYRKFLLTIFFYEIYTPIKLKKSHYFEIYS